MSKKAPTIKITGSGADVVVVRPTGRVVVVNGCDAEDAEEITKRGRLLIEGERAIEVVRTEGDVQIDGDVSDVFVVEGEAVIVNSADEDDDDDDDDDEDEDDDD